MAGTGFLIAYRLPPGRRGHHGPTVLGLKGHDWAEIHFYLSWAFISLAVVHLILHRHWLIRVAGQNSQKFLWVGLAMGLIIMLGFLLIP
jgi:hypothetical protein